MDSRETLERDIEQLEAQLKHRKAALTAFNWPAALPEGESDSPATRFFNVRPLDAIRAILKEHGKPVRKADLRKILFEGGITIGKKRPWIHLDVDVEISVKTGSLTMTGKDELIGLPEWKTKK